MSLGVIQSLFPCGTLAGEKTPASPELMQCVCSAQNAGILALAPAGSWPDDSVCLNVFCHEKVRCFCGLKQSPLRTQAGMSTLGWKKEPF